MADDEVKPFRPDGKIFASNAKTGEVLDFPDIERGWGITFERTAGIPPVQWFNDITKRADLNLQYQSKTGQLSKFDQEYCDFIGGYPKGAVLLADDGLSSYQSLADNNKDNFNDDSSFIGTSWMLWSGNGTGGGIWFGATGGTVDAITASFDSLDELADGMLVSFRATGANTSASPSFNPNDLGALLIVKGANLPLAAGDIGGTGYLVLLQYSATWNRWVLQNPATGIISASSTPVGSGLLHFGSTAPQHYLVCDGSAISRTAYPELFTAIGTIYGEGDGSTTFNLPNMLDRFPQGKNTGFQGIYIDPGLPNTTGSIYGAADISAADGVFSTFVPPAHARISSGTVVSSGVGASFDPSRSNPIYGASNTVQPAALTILPCIKYE
jgi:microcystin-dependent protein